MRVQLRRAWRICARVPIDELTDFAESAETSLGDAPTVRATFTDGSSFEETIDSLPGLRKAGPFDRPFVVPTRNRRPLGPWGATYSSRALTVAFTLSWVRSQDYDARSQPSPSDIRMLTRPICSCGTLGPPAPAQTSSCLRRPDQRCFGGIFLAGTAVSPVLAFYFDTRSVESEGDPAYDPIAWSVIGGVTLSLCWAMALALSGMWASTVTIPDGYQAGPTRARWNPSNESVKRWTVIAGAVGILALLVSATALVVQLTGMQLP